MYNFIFILIPIIYATTISVCVCVSDTFRKRFGRLYTNVLTVLLSGWWNYSITILFCYKNILKLYLILKYT